MKNVLLLTSLFSIGFMYTMDTRLSVHYYNGSLEAIHCSPTNVCTTLVKKRDKEKFALYVTQEIIANDVIISEELDVYDPAVVRRLTERIRTFESKLPY